MMSAPLHSQLAHSHIEDLHRAAVAANRHQVRASNGVDRAHGARRSRSTLVDRPIGRFFVSGRQAHDEATSIQGSELVAR
jgi:hypothetical protein